MGRALLTLRGPDTSETESSLIYFTLVSVSPVKLHGNATGKGLVCLLIIIVCSLPSTAPDAWWVCVSYSLST